MPGKSRKLLLTAQGWKGWVQFLPLPREAPAPLLSSLLDLIPYTPHYYTISCPAPNCSILMLWKEGIQYYSFLLNNQVLPKLGVQLTRGFN